MTVIGVTGKYCAGKNTATTILVEKGCLEIDVDTLGHEALVQEGKRIIDRFGSGVAAPDGSVNRAALAQEVFSDRSNLAALESIVHPVMVAAVTDRIQAVLGDPDGPAGIAVNAAVLCRMGLASVCDTVIFVNARFGVRLRRARERDNARAGSVLRRVAAQRDVSPQFCGPDADIHSVDNNGTREQLRVKLEKLLLLP